MTKMAVYERIIICHLNVCVLECRRLKQKLVVNLFRVRAFTHARTHAHLLQVMPT